MSELVRINRPVVGKSAREESKTVRDRFNVGVRRKIPLLKNKADGSRATGDKNVTSKKAGASRGFGAACVGDTDFVRQGG